MMNSNSRRGRRWDRGRRNRRSWNVIRISRILFFLLHFFLVITIRVMIVFSCGFFRVACDLRGRLFLFNDVPLKQHSITVLILIVLLVFILVSFLFLCCSLLTLYLHFLFFRSSCECAVDVRHHHVVTLLLHLHSHLRRSVARG